MNFELDESIPWDIFTRQTYNHLDNPSNPTNDDLIKILKGTDKSWSGGSDDSPEFKHLREHLGSEGYIMIERGWWNGDRVLKPFVFNGVEFNIGDQFCCGAAMKHHLKFARTYDQY